MEPTPQPQVPQPPPVPQTRRYLPWVLGALFPVVSYFLNALLTPHVPSWQVPAWQFYASTVASSFYVVAVVPIGALFLVGLSWVVTSVGGFAVPSLFGIILVIAAWACIGRGIAAVYRSRARVLLWVLLAVALAGIALYAYSKSSTYRMFGSARENPSDCEGVPATYRAMCFNEAAKATGDVTLCDRIQGYQHLTCIEDVTQPTTYEGCAAIFAGGVEKVPGENMIEVYGCLTRTAARTGDSSLCNYPHTITSGMLNGTEPTDDYFRSVCVYGSGSPEVPMTSPSPSESPVACTTDAYQCPDGTWVGRTGPRCQFECP